MSVRTITYQAMDGKWYDLEIADLIDPHDNSEQLQAENERLKKGIEDTCELIRDKGIVSKWKILNWLEKVLKG